jgi:hypothetical protein
MLGSIPSALVPAVWSSWGRRGQTREARRRVEFRDALLNRQTRSSVYTVPRRIMLSSRGRQGWTREAQKRICSWTRIISKTRLLIMKSLVYEQWREGAHWCSLTPESFVMAILRLKHRRSTEYSITSSRLKDGRSTEYSITSSRSLRLYSI